MLGQPITIYEAVREPTTQTTILDVVLGAMAVVLALAGFALFLGLVWAGVLIGFRRLRERRPPDEETGITRLGLNASTGSQGVPDPGGDGVGPQ